MTTKVFVGNLAFQTTDQALAEAFQDCGKVKSGVVITRGRRSLGYGFVEFESPESALDAVKSKNNTLLKGRTLKVELASDNPIRSINPADPQQQPQRGGGGGGSGGILVNNENNNQQAGPGVMVLPGDVREITEDVVRLTLLLGQGVNLRALRGEIIPKVVIRFPLLQEVIIRIPVRAG